MDAEAPVGEVGGAGDNRLHITHAGGEDIKKNEYKPHLKKMWCIPPDQNAAFVAAMEDVLEEIVGNIEDEHDEEELLIRRNSDGSYTMDGLADMEDVVETLDIPVEEDSFDTLNGFLISLLGKIPADGETARICAYGYIFSIQRIEDKMIREVAITKDTENAKEPADDLP